MGGPRRSTSGSRSSGGLLRRALQGILVLALLLQLVPYGRAHSNRLVRGLEAILDAGAGRQHDDD